MGFDVRSRYLKKTDSKDYTRLENMDLSLERDKERDRYIRMQAIELAKQRGRSNEPAETMTNIRQANAGNNRTTALRQNTNPYGLPVYKGLNTAENGADVDQNMFKTEAATQNGYKGLIGIKSQEQTISKEQSLAHANEVYAPYKSNSEVTNLLNQYVSTNDDLENLRMHGASADQKYHYVREKQKLEKEIKNITGLSKDDFNQIAENYTYLRHDEERKAQQEKLDNASGLEKAALTGLNVATSAIGNYQSAVGLLKKPNDEELGRDYNSVTSYWRNLSSDTKEAVHKDIDESTMADYQKALVGFGYDALTIGAESAASQLLGGAGLASFFAGGYASSLEEAEQRGLTKGQAQGYALVSGGLEYATEKLPWNNLKAIYSGKAIGKDAVKGSLKPYVKALFKQAGEEAGEEVINGVGDILADALINADKSKVNIAIDNYMAEGLSEEEATRKAFFDEGKNILYAAASAAVSAGASAGPALAMEAYGTTKAGRNIADYENKTGNLTRNVENEVYISENREDYDSDEAYNQAMQTRADILAASEKAAKGERISGREARALAESYANIERGTKQEKEENKTENVKPEEKEIEKPKKSYAQIVEDIEFASTPYQLATAIDQVTEETEEIRELIDYKKKELEMFNFKPEEIDNAITEKKALEMGNKGEEVTAEQLEKIPVQDRQKVLEANNKAYNKSILREHPDAVVDKSTGKYFAPAEVKVEGADVVITDTDGNTHSDFENPRINQVMQLVTKTSVDMRGHATDQSMYSTNVEQAAYAIELAVKSPEATSALVRTAVESILDTASVGHKSWEEYLKTSKGLFTKVDEATAEKLYKSIQKPARKSDNRKTENVEGKKTSDKVVSDTLRENLSEETVSLLEALGKKIGYNFVASTNPNARGSITPGTRQISIGTNSLDELWSITAHEAIAEYLQAHGNEEDVTAIQDDMLKYLENKLGSKAFNDLINQYQTVYRESAKKGSVDENKTRRAAANEMFNDTVFALVSSEEGVKDYLDWLNGNNAEVSFFQKVKDFFKSLFDFVSNYIKTGNFNAAERAALEMDLKTAKEFRDRLFKLMDEAIENANSNAESNYNSNEDNSRQSKKIENPSNGYHNLNLLIDMVSSQESLNFDLDLAELMHDQGKITDAEIDALREQVRERRKSLMKSDSRFSMKVPIEASKNLVAVHNLATSEMLKILELGGFPMPSIAITKADIGHDMYGDVSVLFNKSAIDPKANKQNKVYAGDAYTPTFPSIGYKVDSNKIADIRDKVDKLMGDKADSFGYMGLDTDNVTDYLERNSGDVVDAFSNKEGYKYAFTQDKGLKLDVPMKESKLSLSFDNDQIKYIALMFTPEEALRAFQNSLDTYKQFESDGRLEKIVDKINSFEKKTFGKLYDKYRTTEISFSEFDQLLNGINKYYRDGIKMEVDRLAFSEQLNKAINDNRAEYEQWLRDLFEGVILKTGIRNQKDTFTPSGNRRSWDSLYDEYNLLNIVKAMKAEPDVGQGFGGFSIFGSVNREFDSIEDIHSEEDRLQLADTDKYDKIKDEISSDLYDVARRLVPSPGYDAYSIVSDIAEAAAKKKTRSGIKSFLSEWYKPTEDDMDDIMNIIERAKSLPTGYFEAKPKRAVGFDEIASVVVPDLETNLMEALEKKNIPYVTYKAGDKEARKNALNSVPDVRFSKKVVDSQGRELSEGQQEYFKNTKAVDENGNLQVIYHGSKNFGFTVFNRNINFYTDNREVAESYVNKGSDTSGMYEGYLKIENPYIIDCKGDRWSGIAIDKELQQIILNDGGGVFREKGAMRTSTNDIVSAIETLVDDGEADYDGIIFKNLIDVGGFFNTDNIVSTVYATFKSNQFKNVDNLNPTESEDIRYSLKLDSDGNKLSLQQEEMFKNSKAVDKKGNLLVLYHGSQSADRFNTFDMNARGIVNGRAFGDGFYFTPYRDIADFWGEKNLYKVYLNLNNPYYANKSSRVPKDVKKLIKDRYTESLSSKRDVNGAYRTEVKNAYDALEVLWRYGKINDLKTLGYDGVIFDDKDVPKYSVQYVAFNPEQIKETTNLNPTQEAKDIRYSISVGEDRIHTYKGIEIVQNPTNKEYQQMRADIIKERPWMDGPDTILLRHTYDEEGNEYYWDAYAGMHFEIEPIIASHWNTRVNQQWEWWKDDDKDFWANRSFANRARNSIKVYGEASPYADSLNETKVIQTMIGTMNNALSKADAFDISNDELIRIENYIANKYKTDLEPGEIAANISYAFAHMQQNKLDTDYENMMNYLLNIGDEIIKKSNMIDPASKELYDQARAAVSSKRFKLSDAERAEISNAFGGSWKAAFGAMQKAGIKLDNKNGTSIDTVFSEIREDILKAAGVDMSDADKPSQQILSIIDTITALEPTAYLWDGANEMDKALTVVSDIVDQYYSVATEQLEKNIAKGTKKGNEKIKKAIDNEKAKLRGQWAKYKDEKAEEFNSIVAEKNLIIQQQQNQIKQQQEQMKQWNAEAKEKDKAVVLDKKQMEATARLQAKQAVQNYKDREERAKQIENIKKTGIRLIKWLDNPTDNQHVPAFLQRPLAEFLSAIDFLPTNAKADSKSTLTWQQRMNDLREALVKIKDAETEGSNTAEAYFAQNIVAKELISMMDEFLGKEEWDEFTQSYIVTKRAAKKVSLLDAKELATLNKIMSALSVSINNMNKTLANNAFKHVSELAKASVKEVDALPAKKDMQKSLGKIFNFLNFDELEPITWFEGLGSGAKSVFQELRDGFDLKTRHVREADKYMDEAKKELGISDKELSTWKNQLHTFKLTEGTVMLNTTQIMSLYEILKRKQGRPHVAVGGIKAADFEYQDGKIKKKHHQPKAVHIRQTEAQAIIDTLTDEQKALADKMQQFMASDCAAWGNRVTEKMYGYKKYEEKDYFPLKTDAHSRATTASSDNNVSYYTIKNSSFTKPITPMANNAVVLDDIFDVFTDHVVSMADYDAYVMPIADAMRWFNYSERVINAIAPDELNEQGARMDYLGNMQESIDRVYGDAGLQYFRQFIKDINGDYAGRGGKSEILSSLMSMYKAQAVGANMRVVIQQPTAVVRAADQIEPKYLIRALASIPKAIEYAKKAQNNSEIAYWKAQGYYETYLGQSFKEIITGDTTLKDKFNDWSGFLAGQADDLSWGIMYKACEIKVAETQPELTGASFDKAVTKMFEGIVDHTQVVDTIFHKSQWMRSQELGHKVTSAFMAEPTKTYNMLYRAYRDAKLSGNKAFAMKRLRQVGLIFLFEQLLNAIITGGWDMLRDDEKENYISSFTKKFSENALDNLNPLNLLPIAKEITSAIQGYDATAYTTDAIYTAVDSFNVLLKIAQGKSTKTSYGNIYQIAKAASQLTGVPIANVMREFKTIYNLVNDFWGGKDLVNTQAQEKKITKKRETNRVSEVFDSNDLTAIKQEIQTAYNKGVESSKDGSESDGWSASRNMLKEQYQRLLAEHPEEKAAITNRFKSLLKYTKYSDGKNGYRAMTDKEIENAIKKWQGTTE